MTDWPAILSQYPERVSVQVEKIEGTYAVQAPTGQDKKDWIRRLQMALGSRSKAFVTASLDRLLTACCLPHQMTPTSTTVSAALALIESLEPKSEIEAALAVDVACLYAGCGYVFYRLSRAIQERPTTAAANAVGKIERAFHSAVTAYYRVKHGNTQVIRVEKLEVQAGGQAMVGQLVGRP